MCPSWLMQWMTASPIDDKDKTTKTLKNPKTPLKTAAWLFYPTKQIHY